MWKIEYPLSYLSYELENIKSGFKKYLNLIPFVGPINKLINITYYEDDWYIVDIVHIGLSIGTIHYQYKCDQINGLIEFIKSINKNLIF